MSALPNPDNPSFGQITTVLVGPNEESFVVHSAFLRQIPFFQKCLKVGMRETVENIIRLPEDHPAAFTQLVHWLYTKHFEFDLIQDMHDWGRDDATPLHALFPADIRAKLSSVIQVYIMARKFCSEALQNYATDCLRISLDDCHWEYDELQTACDLQDEEDALSRLASLSILGEFCEHCDDWKRAQEHGSYLKFAQQSMEHTNFMLKALHMLNNEKVEAKEDRLCENWHTHIETSKCDETDLKRKIPTSRSNTTPTTDPQSQDAGNANGEESDETDTDFALSLSTRWTELTESRVGPDESVFLVHTSALREIDHFRSTLDRETEDTFPNRAVLLPTADPEAFEQLLHWLYSGKFSFDDFAQEGGFLERSKSHLFVDIKVYLLAQQLNIERLQNLAINIMKRTLGSHDFEVKDLILIFESCKVSTDPLFDQSDSCEPIVNLALWSLAESASKAGTWKDFLGTSLYKDFASLSQENMQLMTMALMHYGSSPWLEEIGGRCKWHVHHKTPECGKDEADFLFDVVPRAESH